MKQDKTRTIRMILSALIFVLVFYAWITMMIHGEGSLQETGLRSLKYFTVDSNLLMGIAALILLLEDLAVLRRRKNEVSAGAVRICYAGTVSVMLTFLVTVLFLTRIYGLWVLLVGANFWMHLVVPLLSAYLFAAYVHDRRLDRHDTAVSLIPLALYAVYYVGMILRYGLEDPRTDWYFFGFAGIQTLPFVLLIIFLVTLGTSLLLRKAANRHG
ncbi:MAG: hypothetical protein IJG05_01270 [Solobacterium sp.]|nr:hypothetical protein [Solobacterium sp.]